MRKLFLFLVMFAIIYSSNSVANDIVFEWDPSLHRQDKSAVTGQLEYVIEYSIDGIDQTPITVSGTNKKYVLRSVAPGNYLATIHAIEDGTAGTKSNQLAFTVTAEQAAIPSPKGFKMGLMVDCN